MPGWGSLSRAISLMEADSRGLVGQAGPAEGWLLDAGISRSLNFLPGGVTCTGAQGERLGFGYPDPVQTSEAASEGGDKGTETLFWLQENPTVTGLPLKWAEMGEGEGIDAHHGADLP